MARTAISNTTTRLLLKPFTLEGFVTLRKCWMSNLGGTNCKRDTKEVSADCRRDDDPLASCWVPHPRSGIFYPRGQEWVMHDVPNEAATFEHTFWLRNNDVVVDHMVNSIYTVS